MSSLTLRFTDILGIPRLDTPTTNSEIRSLENIKLTFKIKTTSRSFNQMGKSIKLKQDFQNQNKQARGLEFSS